MSNNQCYICNNIVTNETKDEIRDKYYNIIGNKLYPGSHLCYICTHFTRKFWRFKTTCLNRGVDVQYGCEEELNWSLLFRLTRDSEKLHNLQNNKVEITLICSDEKCQQDQSFHVHIDNVKNDMLHDLCLKEDQNQQPLQNTNQTNEQSFINEPNHIDDYIAHSESVIDEYVDEDVDCVANAKNEGLDNDFEENLPEYENIAQDETEEENIVHESLTPEESGDELKKEIKKSFIKIVLTYAEQKAVLDAQRKDKRYMEAEFKCHSCALGFLFKDSYQTHMVRHEESNGQYSCNVCTLRFATQNVRCMHVALHAERYKCEMCDATVKRPHRKKHMKECWEVDNDPVSCHLCGKIFKDSCGLQQHLKRFHFSKTNKRVYTCNICGKTYKDQGALRTHTLKHANRRFECDQCTSSFNSPYTLKQHKKTHTNNDQQYCAPCNTWYKTKKHLREHLRNTLRHQQFTFECPVCTRVCSTRHALEVHIEASHSGLKRHVCPLCHAAYSSRRSLLRHALIHNPNVSRDNHFICHMCGKSYREKSKLIRHLKNVCERMRQENEFSEIFADNALCAMP